MRVLLVSLLVSAGLISRAVAVAPQPVQTADGLPVVTEHRQGIERYETDPLAVRALDPTFDMFPDASLVDFSCLLDPPAGKSGWLEVGEYGRFFFEKKSGDPVRFWGVTVAASHVDVPKERIQTVVDVIARSGCNLLRLHELDNRGGEKYNLVRRNIISEDYPNNDVSTVFNPEYRDRVDWWIACAQERGLHVYLVVRGYRTFRAGDNVPAADQLDRSAKPYAFFDPRLVELQKRYAREWLIEHVNPYTGMPNGLNPAVSFLELENEDSLFFHSNWRDMIEPYRTLFVEMWNEWLTQKYGSTEGLRKAWTGPAGTVALLESEDLAAGTVELPMMALSSLEGVGSRTWEDPLKAPARTADGVRFAMDVQRRYFAALRDDLRAYGNRSVYTAVVNSHFLPDTFTVAEELDFVGENAYLDHPSFMPGEAWVGRSFFTNKNYITETGTWGLMPHMARYRWAGSPLVCREWALCWPNECRASGTLDIAAMSAMQDYNGLIHFAYYTWGNPDLITPFGPQSDPVRWGLFPYAALLFRPGTLKAPETGVALAVNDADLATWASWDRPWHRLAWTHRMANWNPDANLEEGAWDAQRLPVTAVCGRSGTGKYMGSNLVLFDARYAERSSVGEASQREGVLVQSGYNFPWIYQEGGFPVDAVKGEGFAPFLVDEEGSCGAFFDAKRNVVVLGDVDEDTAMRVTRVFADQWDAEKKDFSSVAEMKEEGVLRAADGQIVRDVENGLLTIATETVCAVTGELPTDRAIAAGAMEVRSVSPIGAVVAAALDGKALSASRLVAIKMVTVAQNRGQDLVKVDPEKYPNAPGTLALGNYGAVPVQTLGVASEEPTRVRVGGKTLVEAYVKNGTWEVVLDFEKREALVTCDTRNVQFVLGKDVFGLEDPTRVGITRYFYEYPPEGTGQTGWDFVYPGFSKYVRLEVKE